MDRRVRQAIERELDHDRRAEWRLVPLALLALGIVAVVVVLRAWVGD